MPDSARRDDVAALIERMVRESNLQTAAERDDLRRELEAHFEDAVAAAATDVVDPVADAVARFGDVSAVVDGLRHAHRRGRWLLYVAKVAASVIVSMVAAIAVQAVAHVQVGGGGLHVVRLSSWYPNAVRVGLGIVIVAVAAWELGIEPCCRRLDREPLRLLTVLAGFAMLVYGTHTVIEGHVDPLLTFVRAAATIAVWTTTVAIVARLDLAFLRRFGTAM